MSRYTSLQQIIFRSEVLHFILMFENLFWSYNGYLIRKKSKEMDICWLFLQVYCNNNNKLIKLSMFLYCRKTFYSNESIYIILHTTLWYIDIGWYLQAFVISKTFQTDFPIIFHHIMLAYNLLHAPFNMWALNTKTYKVTLCIN